MRIVKSHEKKGEIGILGHAGSGHVHGPGGFVQDDSAGFAVAARLIREAYPVDTEIIDVVSDLASGVFTVKTESGGVGFAKARRGITPYEAELAKRCIGLDALFSQAAAFFAFGRIYGQGVLETPVALQTAIALSVMNTFEKTYQGRFIYGNENLNGSCGRFLGTVLEINEIPVAVLSTLNASEGGIGPVEDMEGNVMIGEKARIMKNLGLDKIPSIILESKAYAPSISDQIASDSIWIRANSDVDNPIVFDALIKGSEKAGVNYLKNSEVYSRNINELKRETQKTGERIANLGHSLSRSNAASEKAEIIAELSILVSQDAGGISFMSNDLHGIVGSGGLMPGTAAVLSMLTSRRNIDYWKIPAFTESDMVNYLEVIQNALPFIISNYKEAIRIMEKKKTRGLLNSALLAIETP